jgi:3-oxoacid CoA-transferase subunit A
MQKIFESADAAIHDVHDGATIMLGGFGLCGIPENLIAALVRRGTKDLTTISNNCGVGGFGLGVALAAGQIRKHIGTYVGENPVLERMVMQGTIELDLVPQGTFVERIRSAGAGVAAFYTPTGVGTVVASGKEAREFEGRSYVLEQALHADFAFVKAWKADRWGNLMYRKTARNFNPEMAMAARVTIAEVEDMVELGEIAPDCVHTPGVYVQRLIRGAEYKKPVERLTLTKRA